MSMYEDISISNYTLVLGPPYVLPYALKDITGRTGAGVGIQVGNGYKQPSLWLM